MTITTEAKQQALGWLVQAQQLMNDALVDLTEDVFEEEPELDEARGLLIEVIERLEEELK